MDQCPLKIEYVDINDLKPYENNAKVHTEEQIKQIKRSIEEFGMNDPIAVWKDDVIIEGHGRLFACQELGMKEVPIIRLDNLTDEQRRAYMNIHNQLTMNTGFNLDTLAAELKAITNIDMIQFGFSMKDFYTDETEDVVEDNYTEPEIKEQKAKYGQVFILGNHVLMCGDSTKPEDVAKLVGGG